MKTNFLPIALLCLLSACGASKKTELAESEVAEFHRAFNAQQFEAIYEKAGKELKTLGKHKEFVDMLKGVHRDLGNAGDTKRITWHINYQTSGTLITMDYQTKFAGGTVIERFAYKIEDDKALLIGYHFRVQERTNKPEITEV
jgi:hypothetical protein